MATNTETQRGVKFINALLAHDKRGIEIGIEAGLIVADFSDGKPESLQAAANRCQRIKDKSRKQKAKNLLSKQVRRALDGMDKKNLSISFNYKVTPAKIETKDGRRAGPTQGKGRAGPKDTRNQSTGVKKPDPMAKQNTATRIAFELWIVEPNTANTEALQVAIKSHQSAFYATKGGLDHKPAKQAEKATA